VYRLREIAARAATPAKRNDAAAVCLHATVLESST
jgi:hypothetical protein